MSRACSIRRAREHVAFTPVAANAVALGAERFSKRVNLNAHERGLPIVMRAGHDGDDLVGMHPMSSTLCQAREDLELLARHLSLHLAHTDPKRVRIGGNLRAAPQAAALPP